MRKGGVLRCHKRYRKSETGARARQAVLVAGSMSSLTFVDIATSYIISGLARCVPKANTAAIGGLHMAKKAHQGVKSVSR